MGTRLRGRRATHGFGHFRAWRVSGNAPLHESRAGAAPSLSVGARSSIERPSGAGALFPLSCTDVSLLAPLAFLSANPCDMPCPCAPAIASPSIVPALKPMCLCGPTDLVGHKSGGAREATVARGCCHSEGGDERTSGGCAHGECA